VENLEWVVPVIQAPDLETLGEILHHRLTRYVSGGAPADDRTLTERLAFEHQVRQYMSWSHERGYPFPSQFSGFATSWVDFVDQNKAAEAAIARDAGRRSYDAPAATTSGNAPAKPRASISRQLCLPPLTLRLLTSVALIERIVHR
jgi:hypothetical protein